MTVDERYQRLEDTVREDAVADAERMLRGTLSRIASAAEGGSFFLPPIFVRVRSPEQLLRLAEEPKIALQSTETVDYAWLTPVEMLERCRAGMVIGHLAERFARYAVMLEDVLQKEGEK